MFQYSSISIELKKFLKVATVVEQLVLLLGLQSCISHQVLGDHFELFNCFHNFVNSVLTGLAPVHMLGSHVFEPVVIVVERVPNRLFGVSLILGNLSIWLEHSDVLFLGFKLFVQQNISLYLVKFKVLGGARTFDSTRWRGELSLDALWNHRLLAFRWQNALVDVLSQSCCQIRSVLRWRGPRYSTDQVFAWIIVHSLFDVRKSREYFFLLRLWLESTPQLRRQRSWHFATAVRLV